MVKSWIGVDGSGHIGPLPIGGARRTLAQRYGHIVDRARQKYTDFGLRSKRVFLVWTIAGGEERGEGTSRVLARVEILPTPRVSDLTGISRQGTPWGTMPAGSIRVDEISVVRFTDDVLRGLAIPDPRSGAVRPVHEVCGERGTDPKVDFFYEVVEDGRGDNPAARQRFYLSGYPYRNEEGFMFGVVLERASVDPHRDGDLDQPSERSLRRRRDDD